MPMYELSEDPWGDRPPPLLRRPLVRGAITFFVVFTFLLLTFVSTCSPRITPIGTTTTTIDGVTALGANSWQPAPRPGQGT